MQYGEECLVIISARFETGSHHDKGLHCVTMSQPLQVQMSRTAYVPH